MSLRTFIDAYTEAAFWSSTDDDGTPLDQVDAMPALETLEGFEADCRDFYAANEALWSQNDLWSDEEAGHDFWLTRNGHGAGFWDRYSKGDGARIGDELTKAAKAYGSVDLYVGDNGTISGS